MAERLTRERVPLEQTWNLAHIFPNDAAWSAAVAAVEAGLEAVTRYQGRLGQNAAELLAALRARDALQAQLVRVGAYAMLASAGDGANPTADGQRARAQALSARVDAALAFFRTELAALPAGTLTGVASR